MSRFLRTLVKVGLVELDPDEHDRMKPTAPGDGDPSSEADIDALLKSTESLLSSASAPPRAPTPPSVPRPAPTAARAAQPVADRSTPNNPPKGGVVANRALADIYAEAGVPASPFPAEKLARLLDGLRAMEPAMRRAAVTAMDEADDQWNIGDPLQDAQRKVAALHRARAGLQTAVEAAETRAAAALDKANAYQKEATDKIKAQQAELEALLQEELATVAKQRAEAEAALQAAREGAAAEQARLDAEISSLNSILVAFAPPSPPKAP